MSEQSQTQAQCYSWHAFPYAALHVVHAFYEFHTHHTCIDEHAKHAHAKLYLGRGGRGGNELG